MKFRIYIDDERNPKTDHNWIVVRNMDDFVQLVTTSNFDDIEQISFDHDLGDGVPTGHDISKWLVNYLLDTNQIRTIPYNVHSANPVGGANIQGVLNHYNRFVERVKNHV